MLISQISQLGIGEEGEPDNQPTLDSSSNDNLYG